MERNLKIQLNKIIDNEIHNMPYKNRKKLNFLFGFKRIALAFLLIVSLILVVLNFLSSLQDEIKIIFVIILIPFIVLILLRLIKLLRFNNDNLIEIYLNKKYSKLKSSFFDEKLVFAEKREKNWLLMNDFTLQKKINIGTLKSINGYIVFDLLLDNENKKFVFCFGNDTYSEIFNYRDIISYNTYTVNSTASGRMTDNIAVVSDKVFEPIAQSAKDYVMPSPHKDINKNYCDNIIFKIQVDKKAKKTLTIVYNFNKILKTSQNYKKLKNNSEELVKVFDKIMDLRRGIVG